MLLTRTFPLALGLLVVTPALAAEGVLPIGAGDRVEGEVRWCGDRHVLSVDLVRGERLRAKVRAHKSFTEDLTVRFYDPSGLSANAPADVRVSAGVTSLGPFRVTESGTHLMQITTFTRHEIPYEVVTKIKGRKKRTARVKANVPRQITAAAGSILRLRGLADTATVELKFPSGTSETLEPGSACLETLTGGGLTLPDGGAYGIVISEGRAKLRLRAPRRGEGRVLQFPELPDERDSVSSWYDDTGWVADPFASAPADHEPPVSLPGPGNDPGGPRATLTDAPSAPTSPDVRTVFGVPANPGGHRAGIGMPIAPMPTIEETLAHGRVEPFTDGPSYVFDVVRPGLGSVRYRVSFVVGGRTSLAPVSLDGHVTMRWSAEGGGTFHEEDWSLTTDPTRGVQVLDGSALFIGSGFTTIRSAADGFAFPTDGSAPYGALSWGVESAADGTFLRAETHHGTGGVDVSIR